MASFPKVLTNWRVSAKAEFPFSETEKINFKHQIHLPLSGEAEKFRWNKSPMHTQEIFSNTFVHNTRRSSGCFDLIFTVIQAMDAEVV